MSTPAAASPALVWWSMPTPDACDLASVLALLEDFRRQASTKVVTELATYPLVAPDDPVRRADWLADYLGDQALALQALTHPARPTPTGDST